MSSRSRTPPTSLRAGARLWILCSNRGVVRDDHQPRHEHLSSVGNSSPPAAVPGLTRSDPHSPGIVRERSAEGFDYLDSGGGQVADATTLERISALGIPPA